MSVVPVLGLLFAKGAASKITGAPGGEIPIDAFITRGHAMGSSVTRAPVEDGSNINDHVILDAKELTIEGLTSDHPVNLLANPAAVVGAAREVLGSTISDALGLGGGLTRSQEAAKKLENAWITKAELEVVTRLFTYKRMVIQTLEWNESADVGEALAFRMQLIQLTKVTLQRVPSSRLAAAVGSLAEGPVEAGRQAPKPKPKNTSKAAESLGNGSHMHGEAY